jgi:glutaredoxin
VQKDSIIFYGASWCGDCIKSKYFLDLHKVEYTYIDIETDEEAVETVLRLNNGRQTIPTILFPDGNVLVEPTFEQLAKQLHLVS